MTHRTISLLFLVLLVLPCFAASKYESKITSLEGEKWWGGAVGLGARMPFEGDLRLFDLSAEDFGKIVLAYEPVWAIGTGKTASPEQAQEIHAFIRSIVADKYGKEIADNTSILYGGSAKPSNAKELFANPDVDGGLIGGAALKVADFKGIIDAFN